MAEEEEKSPAIKMSEFLESVPPDSTKRILDLRVRDARGSDIVQTPELLLHCWSEDCNGLRKFQSVGHSNYLISKWTNCFLEYTCRNCGKSPRTYAIRLYGGGRDDGIAMKLGEAPTFGPPIPARVISLIGPDRDLFLRGYRSETHGLGVGAFAYYRRVVENQKGRIIGEMAKVAAKLGAEPSVLEMFDSAASETQFSKAVDQIRTAIPPVLLTEGHNPLTLLHTALSEGLHQHSDEECLSLASEIRMVLTDLAERISQALKTQTELRSAVSRLLNRVTARPETDSPSRDDTKTS